MSRYIYPKLPAAIDLLCFRVGGSGLANCLFVYAKAIVLAHLSDAKIIAPTWRNLSLGTYLRKETDKRHYCGLFTKRGEVSGIKRWFYLLFKRRTNDINTIRKTNGILEVEGIYDFFTPLLDHHKLVADYILSHINTGILKSVASFDFKKTIAVHIRLGDFPASRRVPMEWYISKIKDYNNTHRILLFSDGSDSELKDVLSLNNVKRVYFGGAIQDIVAISKCDYLIGSDSSFSAWGAFLGQVPCTFYKLQFGKVLYQNENQIIEHT